MKFPFFSLIGALAGLGWIGTSHGAVLSNEILLSGRGGGTLAGGPYANDCSLGGRLTAGAFASQGIFELYSTTTNACIDLKAGGGSLGVAHSWFLISPGAEISPATVASFPNLLGTGTTVSASLDTVFYLGVWTDTTSANGMLPGPSVGDHFGWAQVVNESTGLRLISQASETTGAGIYAATLTVVPEPANLGLLCGGLLVLSRAHRRGRKTR